jgi:hypothetical protein
MTYRPERNDLPWEGAMGDLGVVGSEVIGDHILGSGSFDIATPRRTIWANANTAAFVIPTADVALEAVSTSASDTAVGTGVRTIIIEGCGPGFAYQTEAVVLNGTTPVGIPGTWRRINNVYASVVGSNGLSVGAISVRDSGGGTTRDVIPVGETRALAAFFCVPDGYKIMVLKTQFSCQRNGDAQFFLEVRTNPTTNANPDDAFVTKLGLNVADTLVVSPHLFPFVAGRGTDIRLRCISRTNNNKVWGSFEAFIFPEDS